MAAVSASDTSDLKAQLKTSQRLYKAQRYPAALSTLARLLEHVDAPSDLYDRGVKLLLDIVDDPRVAASLPVDSTRQRAMSQLLRAAFFARLYLARSDDLQALADDRRFGEKLPLLSALFLASRDGQPGPPKNTYAFRAAEIFLAHGRLVRAAAAFARAGDRAAADRCYEQLVSSPATAGRPSLGAYERALIHFQLAVHLLVDWDADHELVVYRGDANAVEIHRHAVAAQAILEQLADDFEARMQPERAIDVYCILIALGRALGRFEHVAEGFVGCLRLLKQERLITATLHAYEDFLAYCTERTREHALAGQQAREAAEFLDACGLPWGDHYRARAAEYFEQATEDPRLDASRRESLLLHALSLWNGLGAARKAQAVLARLANEAPTERTTLAAHAGNEGGRRARYQRLANDYEQVLGPLHTPPAGSTASSSQAAAASYDPSPWHEAPPSLADRTGELPVWNLDLYEWEDGGDPTIVAAALLCESKRPLLCRRYALRIGLLNALGPPWTDLHDPLQARLQQVDALSGLLTYEALRPLEVIYEAASLSGPFPTPSRENDPAWQTSLVAVDPSDPAAARALLLAPQPPDPSAPNAAFTIDGLLHPHARAALRRRIVLGLSRLPYRRALQCVLRGLTDPDVSVFAASLDALSHGRYIGSVSLLCRLLQDPKACGLGGSQLPAASLLDIRRVALVALSRTRDLRAYTVLLDVYRSEPEPLRSEAFHLLRYALASDANLVRPLLLRAAASNTPDTQALRTLVGE